MTDTSDTCRWHGKDSYDCLRADARIMAMGLPVHPHGTGVSIDQHNGRRVFSERVEEGTTTPNNVHENTFGDKIFTHNHVVSETYNSANDAIHSAYRSSELYLYQCRLYKKVATADRENWDRNEDFFSNLRNNIII